MTERVARPWATPDAAWKQQLRRDPTGLAFDGPGEPLDRVSFEALIIRQLQALRARPVTLPGYAFYVTDRPVKASTIQVIGTWLAAPGSTLQPPVQTTNLECKRAAMRCVGWCIAGASTQSPRLTASRFAPVRFKAQRWPAAAVCAALP